MRLASPVWKTMLDPEGPFIGSLSNGEVHFAEDDAAAIILILRIAHLQFRELPDSLDFHQLISLAVVCDKYDTTALIRPWIEQWKNPWSDSFTFKNAQGYDEILFFVWTFGDLATYENVAKGLIRNSTSDGEGQLFADGKLLGNNMPPGAIDCILEARIKVITALLEACSKVVESYESDTTICHTSWYDHNGYPRSLEEIKSQCDTLMYGYLIKGLKTLGIWPNPVSPSDMHKSVTHLVNDLRSMECRALEGDIGYHADCVITRELYQSISLIESDIPSGIDDPLRKHMEEQAKK